MHELGFEGSHLNKIFSGRIRLLLKIGIALCSRQF